MFEILTKRLLTTSLVLNNRPLASVGKGGKNKAGRASPLKVNPFSSDTFHG